MGKNSSLVAYDFDKSKEEYRELCKQKDICVFMKDWYLDATCNSVDDWQVILIKKGSNIVAAFPFKIVRKKGLKVISNPWLTPRMGVWIDYNGKNSVYKRDMFLSDIISQIIKLLPKYDYFSIAFNSEFDNWQDFYRNGFSQTVFYSYLVDYKKVDEAFNNIRPDKRRLINKSYSDNYTIVSDLEIEKYWTIFERCYDKNNKQISYTKEQFLKLDANLNYNGCRKILACKNNEDKYCSLAYIIEDSKRCYYLVGVSSHEDGNAAQARIIWECIQYAISKGKIFDFEGSMIEGIAKYYVQFCNKQEPYYVLSNTSKKYQFLYGGMLILKSLKR